EKRVFLVILFTSFSGSLVSRISGAVQVDVPGWIDKKAFASVKGMNEPADGAINLVKTSNGWRAN
ncbi:hypothetical protein C9Y88_23160, partial [Escherichia coli]